MGHAAVSRTFIPHIHYLEILQVHFNANEVARGKPQLFNSMFSNNQCFVTSEVMGRKKVLLTDGRKGKTAAI